ncbi:MAG: argininosuccinate lyase [Paracoccaceae bacterium]
MSDQTVFPDPVYKETVLAPLFDGAKAHFAPSVRAVNQAHLVMLQETGILTADTAAAIAGALQGIDAVVDLDALTYTGEFEDYFFLVEAELKNRLGADVAGALHTARSRNDMDHTVFKMVLTGRVDALLTLGRDLAAAILDTAEREKATLIVAYTHGQPAQPSTFGHYLAAVADVLLRDLGRIDTARDHLTNCPMGAAAITTTGFAINRERMAELLGFQAPTKNSYGSIAAIDYVTGLYSAVKLLFLHLGRVVQDFQFWSAFEVGQLYVPNSFVQISSIMPQKRNPVPIEHLRLLSSLTVGRCDMMVNTMHNTPFTDMNDSEGEVQQAGYSAFESGGRVLELLTALIPALSIRADRVRANTDAACITVTELADTLVRDEGLSFRQAHEIAAATSQVVTAENATLAQGFIAFKAAFQTATERYPTIDEAAFQHAVSPENFVAVRDRFGGPAPASMDIALASFRQDLKILESNATLLRKFKIHSTETLQAAFSVLTSNNTDT